MDPNAPSISTAHRASSGVHTRKSVSSAPSPRLMRHPRRLVESYIRPFCVDPNDDVDNTTAGVIDLNDAAPSARGHTLPDVRVAMPDLLGLDSSHHPPAYLHANEV